MTDVPEISARVWQALTHVGWVPDRAWDTSAVADAHRDRGWLLHEAPEAFLRRFGGLLLDTALDTDAQAALASASDERLRDAAEWIGEPLSVIGRAEGHRTLLLMSERGTFWAHTDKMVISHGRDVAGILERYCPGPAVALN